MAPRFGQGFNDLIHYILHLPASLRTTSPLVQVTLLLFFCTLNAVHAQSDAARYPHDNSVYSSNSLLVDHDQRIHRVHRKCYDDFGKPHRCYPAFENAAFMRPIEATNTCGMRMDTYYCIQTGVTNIEKTCLYCRRGDHPPTHLNDFNDNKTWWQSETMAEGIQYPTQVNITLNLGKSFDITYVRLRFHSPRPHSFSIFKKTTDKGEWVPFQYYSLACLQTYGVNESSEATPTDETEPLCTSEFSEISPLQDGNVVFTTLEGRPSANDFEHSPLLQEFVTATQIRIVLQRLNTFGDEVFRDPQVLRSYYYAISDLAVGGRCKCNGHASECVAREGVYGGLMCRCEHNTTGSDCSECLPFYNDQPWSVATSTDAHECQPCNCNGKSRRCFFDRELWERTGHGGHCVDCSDNTDGPNCERCKDNYYQTVDGRCVACNCDETGSASLQCNSQGECICKPGVEGKRCDRCAPNHYDFSSQGCKSCGCSREGSYNNREACNPVTGQCMCKQNVEGQQCDRCKPGFFDLQLENEFGCLPCFCFGHSAVCSSATGFSKYSIDTSFARDSEKWSAQDRYLRPVSTTYNSQATNLAVRSQYDEIIYFVAPERYLGDQKSSYNQFLTFSLHLDEDDVKATLEDVVIRSGNLAISQPIFGQGNPIPSRLPQIYRFRLHNDHTYGWSPRLSAKEFISILSNITAILIRGNYRPRGSGYIDEVKLESAQQNPYGMKASWVETCQCPTGYVGQFCESCAPGYRHDPPNGGSFATCVPCNCNNHADNCDADTGRCICHNNTAGDNCETCALGYYGNAVMGTEDDCQPCPCPDKGACVVLSDNNIVCLQCPEGYTGPKCEMCVDGYHGNPGDKFGLSTRCRKCNCNENVDPNAIGNCDTVTGECLKCIYNTYGSNCEKCAPGYYGNALALPKGNCKSCGCHPQGTRLSDVKLAARLFETTFLCDQESGQCDCKSNVMGRQCNVCVDGYWNIGSGNGCEACNCNTIGSEKRSCDDRTGQCTCKPGVTGKHCDQCLPHHYGFSVKGCMPCECDKIGSSSFQCDERGQCPCRENIEGRRCDRCRENKFDKSAGCLDCPPCYNLVQDAVNAHRSKVGELTQLLDEIEKNPGVVEDQNFEVQLQDVTKRAEDLYQEAKQAQGADGSLIAQLDQLRQRIEKVKQIASQVSGRLPPIQSSITYGSQNISLAEDILKRAENSLANARKMLDNEGIFALVKANERSKKYGQQSERMSEIARLARNMADNHESTAQTIVQVIEEALNTSRKAYNLAKDAIVTQEANRKEIENLRRQLEEANDLLQRTKKMADEAKKEATKAYNDALEISTDVSSITVPDLESDKIKQEATDIIRQAKQISSEADELLAKYAATLNGTKYQLGDAKDLLEEAIRQQQMTDALLTDADEAYNRAKEAIIAGEATLKDANETLKTLKEFDEVVTQSKDKAREAMGRVEAIRKLIEEAIEKTGDAEKALQGALKDAIEARDVAMEAQSIAEKASKDATRIHAEARATMTKVDTLKNQADVLTKNIEETQGQMKQFEEQAENDEKLAKDTMERANQAKTSTLDARNKVENASKTVEDILNALDNLEYIDQSLLEELEKRLNQAEREMKEADLENRVNNLKMDRDNQEKWMRNYDDEIEKLKEDVRNVAEIRAAIPQQCFKVPRLEP